MWIFEIFLESFGAFTGVRITRLGQGLNVLIGPNEAGKSTVLEFIRSIFFGFGRKKGRANIYETPDLVPRKGSLSIVSANGSGLRFARTEKRGRREGVLSITDESGTTVDPASIPLFQGGMARNVYESLFAYDLEQLRTLDRENLRAKILGAALGSSRINPVEVLGRVESRMKALVKRSANEDRSLWTLQARIKEVDKTLRDLSDQPDRYTALKKELEETEKARKELGKRITGGEVSLEDVNKYLRYEEEWKSLQAIDIRAAELADASVFPADGVTRLEQMSERLRTAEQAKTELGKRLANLSKRLDVLMVDPKLLEYADDIRRLTRAATSLAKRPIEIANLEEKTRQSQSALNKEIAELGPGWTIDRVASTDTSMVAENELIRLLDSRRLKRGRQTDVGRKVEEQQARTQSLNGKISAHQETIEQLAPSCEGFLNPEQRGLLGEWKEHHSQLGHLKERISDRQDALGQLRAQREVLERNIRELSDNKGRAIGTLPGLLLLMLLIAPGAVGMLFNFQYAAAFSYGLHVACGGYMVLAVLLFVGWKLLRERKIGARIERELESLRGRAKGVEGDASELDSQIKRYRSQAEHLRSRMAQVGDYVLGYPQAGQREIMEAERRSSLAEEPVRKFRSVQDALESYRADLDAERRLEEDLESSRAKAQRDFDNVNTEWRVFLTAHSLDPGIEPETAQVLIRALRQIKNDSQRVAELEANLASLRREWEQFVSDALRLSVALERPLTEEASPVDQVEHWSRLEREAAEAVAERKSLSSEIDDCRIRQEVEERNAEEAGQQISALLEKAGVMDEEAFRNLALRHGQLRDVLEQRKALTKGLISGLRFSDEESMCRAMGEQDWEANGNTAARLQSELHRMRKEAEESANQSGGLTKEIEALEAQEESEKLLAVREQLLVRLNESAVEWVRMKMASVILKDTIQVYEREKQPAVLEKSSKIFGQMTGGAFKKVLMPFDEDGLKVERDDGTLTSENHLSRGTLEQLYLALRLAHLEVYHGSDGANPVVLDDILVNFDPGRARRTAEELVRFSEETGIQILFFTCHPHMADLFPEQAIRHSLI
jgi:uncharacterized protein YhaN